MCVSPYIVKNKDGDFVPVPCGKCFECLQQWSKDWRFRLKQEQKNCSWCCFLTLTYNDAHIPVKYNDEVGEWQSYVDKKELQDFFKRVRFHAPKSLKFRYFAVGEYGGDYNRAHYHVCFFIRNTAGLTFREFYRLFLYCWQGRGFIYLKTTTRKQINYVSAYFNKIDKSPHITKPFKLMSKSLGLCYLSQRMVDYFFRTFATSVPNPFGKGFARLPRYYRKKLDEMTNDVEPDNYGYVWSDIVRLRQFEPRTNVAKMVNYFCHHYKEVFHELYKREINLCRVYGFHSMPKLENINVLFSTWSKDIPELINARATARRRLDDAIVHHKYTKLNEITYLYSSKDG